ncbi:MAG: hypothetical protein DHS20C11_05350 [Lysobacteraceae bacterium]|nr:MAG: hypothetical protein DHS20C11_05350 [Xanthomonadaceae bacterium]
MSWRRARLFSAIQFGLGVSLATVVSGGQIKLGNLGDQGYTITGQATDGLRASVSGAGDVNGDGIGDLILGGRGASAEGKNYVVFGRPSPDPVDLASELWDGFQLNRALASDAASIVSGAGDVNGDGLADLIVGAPFADALGLYNAGECYLVFGKTDASPVDLDNLGEGGFPIRGASEQDRACRSFSGAGDVNGDGLADIVIGAHLADPYDRAAAGMSYVVFGKTDSDPVDLSTLVGGFAIFGAAAGDQSGFSVSGAGDVNGDGLDDVIIGAPYVEPAGGFRVGASYVIFGKTDEAKVLVDALGDDGFAIHGIDDVDYSGSSVSGAGDVNGDGLADLVIGAPGVGQNYGYGYHGESYVVFGKADTSTVALGNLSTKGFRIKSSESYDYLGRAVAAAGDINGDGLSDVILGAVGPGDSWGGPPIVDEGEAYVVFGKADDATVLLSVLDDGGFSMLGEGLYDSAAAGVSSIGDSNQDGLPDIVVSAPLFADGSGKNYVIFSPESAPDEATYRGTTPPGEHQRNYPIGVAGDGSMDGSPDSRVWIGFDAGPASNETVELHRTGSMIGGTPPGVPASVMWKISSDRTGWTEANVRLKYLPSEAPGFNGQLVEIAYSSSPAGPWTSLPTAADAGTNSATATTTELGYFIVTIEDFIFDSGFGD